MRFNIFKKKVDSKQPPAAEPEDFYVENGVCTSCGAPQAEAPDLIDHSDKDWGHCYFKKQPETDEEIERAINAIAVSCISGLRYRGKDEKILKRLYEMGEAAQCDYEPIGHYKLIVWNKVTFEFSGTMNELSDTLSNQIIAGHTHLNKQITDFTTNNKDSFQFTYRWTTGLTGINLTCHTDSENIYEIQVEKEQDGFDHSIRYSAMTLHSILRNDNRILNISWFDRDGNTYTETQIK